VDAEDACAAFAGETCEGDGGPVAGGRGGRAGELADEGFAADAEEDGAAVEGEGVGMAEDGEIVFEAFAEADAWVEGDGVGVDACGGGEVHGVAEGGGDFGDGVGVAWAELHGARGALHVHEDEAGVGGGGGGGHEWVEGEPGDIVDDVSASGDGCGGDIGFHGVDGEGGVGEWAEGLGGRG
jgi:hypothetical protein